MILKSLHMDNFGLFRGKALEFGPGFNLIFGANESGKTTLVDAIVISLLARTDKKGGALKSMPRSLKHLKDRYGSEISLRVVVNQDDRELDFPDPETFRDRWGIGWDELRAIFIAREGDLELARGDGREFRDWWETLKGKLLGFQEEPRQVLKKIAAEADLTENLGLKEAHQRRTEEIQQKLTWFTDNEQRIHSLRGLEKTYDELKLKEKKLLQEAENTKKGVHKARLLRADEMYRQMKITGEKLQAEHGRYTEKDLNEWQKLAGESDKEAAQLAWLRQQKDQEQTRHKDAQTKMAQLVRQVGLLSEKLRSAGETALRGRQGAGACRGGPSGGEKAGQRHPWLGTVDCLGSLRSGHHPGPVRKNSASSRRRRHTGGSGRRPHLHASPGSRAERPVPSPAG